MLHDPIRLLVFGAGGRMGRAVISLLPQFPALQLEAVVSRAPPELPSPATILSANDLEAAPEFDVAIDFSLPAAFESIVDFCRRRRSALVSGTTGLSLEQRGVLDEAARDIPVLWASNFSPGMAVLGRLAELAAAALPEWDVEISEAHHRHKRDAPSGSALTLADAIARGRGDAHGHVVRAGAHAARTGAEIGIASLRGGDVVGDHTVSLFGAMERLELSHRAHDRAVFAYGALVAAQRLAGQPPGAHSLADLLLGA